MFLFALLGGGVWETGIATNRSQNETDFAPVCFAFIKTEEHCLCKRKKERKKERVSKKEEKMTKQQ